MKRYRIEPLFRKVNSTARGSHHNSGGDAKRNRHTKKGMKKSMHGLDHHGLDFTPLYRFLLSKVGEDYNKVYSEAVARLGSIPLSDKEESISWIIAKDEDEVVEHGYRRIGESSYFSQLLIDENGKIQVAKPEVTNETLFPDCDCCTWTFNGKLFVNKYVIY